MDRVVRNVQKPYRCLWQSLWPNEPYGPIGKVSPQLEIKLIAKSAKWWCHCWRVTLQPVIKALSISPVCTFRLLNLWKWPPCNENLKFNSMFLANNSAVIQSSVVWYLISSCQRKYHRSIFNFWVLLISGVCHIGKSTRKEGHNPVTVWPNSLGKKVKQQLDSFTIAFLPEKTHSQSLLWFCLL